MRKIILFLSFAIATSQLLGQGKFEGKIISAENGQGLADVYVTGQNAKVLTVTDSSGYFNFSSFRESELILFSKIGFKSKDVKIEVNSGVSTYMLEIAQQELDEVVISTGYQSLSKERATGSFTYVNNELLNRSVSTDVISRLEGVVGSLQFDRRAANTSSTGRSYRELRIRGISTLSASSGPLIIIDNFPFEGDVNALNPNDILSVTVLKDAAAASIWGAKAGNGVIVITTKNGKYNSQPSLGFSANFSVKSKPDLLYSPEYIDSKSFLEAERYWFEKGLYDSDIDDPNRRALTPAIDLWSRLKSGLISQKDVEVQLAAYQEIDFRKEAEKHLYRNAFTSQYTLNSNGGGKNYRYYLSGGIDKNREEVIGNNFERYTVNSSSNFQPVHFLEFQAALAFSKTINTENGTGIAEIKGKAYPYKKLADEEGNALSVPFIHSLSYAGKAEAKGLLNWEYKPLDEINQKDYQTNLSDLRINLGAKIDVVFIPGLTFDVKYFHQTALKNVEQLDYKDSYRVRDLVNKYTQGNGTQIFPYGDILRQVDTRTRSNNGRATLSYQQEKARQKINILSGLELREVVTSAYGFEQYGFDREILIYNNRLDYNTIYATQPIGSSRLPTPSFPTSKLTDRFISAFTNGSYEFKDKYIFSGSLRWDASNLLGVKTNQKGVPLWSIGHLWKINKEPFFDFSDVDFLNIKLTAGMSGNLNRSASAYPTAIYQSDAITGIRKAIIRNAGNPQLRWEKILTINFGTEFSFFDRRISGSLEYYLKRSADLLGSPRVDPTVGYKTNDNWIRFLVNYAGLVTHGTDMEINTINTKGKIKWSTVWMGSYTANRVTRYDQIGASSVLDFTNNVSITPVINQSADAIFSILWQGLNPQTGDPLIISDGVATSNFGAYFNSLTLDDLVYSGVTVPRYFGSIRNIVSIGDFSVSFNLLWKAGFVFRRKSIDYNSLFSLGKGHQDFYQRWEQAGDELRSQVPSMPSGMNLQRDYLYSYSNLLIEKGDHLRFQDINVSYDFKRKRQSLKVFFFASNLGILWKRSKLDLDPDYPGAMLPPNRLFSVGITTDLK